MAPVKVTDKHETTLYRTELLRLLIYLFYKKNTNGVKDRGVSPRGSPMLNLPTFTCPIRGDPRGRDERGEGPGGVSKREPDA
jgi:hypothetical protein